MEENVATNAEPVDNRRNKPNMTSDEKQQLIFCLMMRIKPDTNPPELQRGTLAERGWALAEMG
jgi:hypothetical protein